MYHPLVNRCSLTSGAVGVSPPVSMEGANAIQAEVTVSEFAGTNISVLTQISNDLDNWSSPFGPETVTAAGSKLLTKNTGIAMAYVRLQFTHTGTGTCVFAAGLNPSLQH